MQSIKHVYAENLDELFALEQERVKYRDRAVNTYIAEVMHEYDFFICVDMGMKFENTVTYPSHAKFCNNILALFGIDSDHAVNFFTRNDAYMRVIPLVTRKRIQKTMLQFQVDSGRFGDQEAYLKGV